MIFSTHFGGMKPLSTIQSPEVMDAIGEEASPAVRRQVSSEQVDKLVNCIMEEEQHQQQQKQQQQQQQQQQQPNPPF